MFVRTEVGDDQGRLGFCWASTPFFFFDCFSSFPYLAEFFSEPRREGKEDLEKISKLVANILKD
jgi:hypothetical protein